ncbi:MAG: peptidase vanX D-ala-D-ala dipeptidase [Bacteroidota bacterium]|jgi:D-alanyl-D-alanine dipeptidase|nr:peptidase vanX D-ala-D-ala dipeptidase [Bacteroidota bacterium]
MRQQLIFCLFFFGVLTACETPVKKYNPVAERSEPIDSVSLAEKNTLPPVSSKEKSEIELYFIKSGLVDIETVDSSIKVDLKYSGCDNFLFLDMYGDLEKCYLRPDVARKLKDAQTILHSKFPYYSLIVFDGVRPRSIQFKMWDTIAVPASERSKYVSNPQNGSVHNFGAAVDLSIIDENGIELDMGTPYDFFGELAYPREEDRMIKEKKLSYKQLFNREVLRDAMTAAGFLPITTEWWHFNSCTRSEAIKKYKIIE